MLKQRIRHWGVKARASHTQRDATKARAQRRCQVPQNRRPGALPEYDAYDEVVEASFPASDPPPYVRDPDCTLVPSLIIPADHCQHDPRRAAACPPLPHS
jgi:hypothetical protein